MAKYVIEDFQLDRVINDLTDAIKSTYNTKTKLDLCKTLGDLARLAENAEIQ